MTRLKEIQQKSKQLLIKQEQVSKVINCEIKKGKLITQLNGGREISILVSLLTKWRVLSKDVMPEQLKIIWTPKWRKVYLLSRCRWCFTSPRIISEGLFKSCWERQ
jgi:hypothetical protein